MDLQTRKLDLIQAFLKVQSEKVISRLEKILLNDMKKSANKDFEPMTIQEFEERIEKSMADSKDEKLLESDDFKSKIDQWN